MTLQLDLLSGAFWSDGPTGPRWDVRGWRGREAVGQLFEHRLLLQRAKPLTTAEIDEALTEPCALRFEDTAGHEPERRVYGLISRLDRLDSAGEAAAYYYVEVVPRAWLLTTNRCSRAFMSTNVRTIVSSILAEYGFAENEDFVFRLSETPRELEYVVKYEESDWAFVQRWLEHEGYTLWFDHAGDCDLLVVADGPVGARTHSRPIGAHYRASNLTGQQDEQPDSIHDWTRQHRRTPRRVALVDYDPGHRLVAGANPVASTAVARWLVRATEVPETDLGGGSFHFGAFGSRVSLARFTTASATDGDGGTGSALSQKRAEAVAAERVIYAGRTQSRQLHPGSVFELIADRRAEAGPDDGDDAGTDAGQRYFVTEMTHRYGVPVDQGKDAVAHTATQFLSDFRAVRATIPYRPPLVTPWPRVHGVVTAHVVGYAGGAGDAGEKYPCIDEHGRYKVRLPFAVAGDATVYAWVRMAEPMAGQSYGMHLPLHPGTEVLLAHIDGDPDRPVIVGAVPNGSMPTSVTREDAPKARWRSSGGVQIELDDYTG